MSRAVAVPVVDRSAALVVAGLAGLSAALILFCASLAVGLGGSDYASFYAATPGDAVAAAVLAAASGLGALFGAVAFLLGAYRAVANMDRYLAFRVAIMPRRVEPPTPGEVGPEVGPAGLERASGAVR
ncbi:hypothetical protein [Oerskovia sp. KBS0722]|uniref:hypothetical protein n=1 Tax=Oerskovia sp. KBS0722 TaxID=1179673 RepID=UPI00110EE9A9|nr:hypothetical protein [Oerskovia sp. KBS0722]QDW63724.1 hypothetical protein FFI11_015490 [Oerskovia sp. KBS0722]